MIKEHKFPKGKCVLLDDRAIVFDKKLASILFEKEFFGKPFGQWLQISFVETLYLNKSGIVEISTSDGKKVPKDKVEKIITKKQPDIKHRLAVFEDLKKRGLIVKTGFKFGSHFRAYTKGPDETHAEYLIHVVSADFKSIWEEISRAVRLAHSVNKEICLAQVSKSKIDYIKFGRLRP
jgi:tRNA-intron endonuclease